MRGRNKNFHDLFTVLKRRKTTCTNGEGYKLSCHWLPQSQHGRNVFLRPENPVCMHPKGHLMVRVLRLCMRLSFILFFLVLFFRIDCEFYYYIICSLTIAIGQWQIIIVFVSIWAIWVKIFIFVIASLWRELTWKGRTRPWECLIFVRFYI